jgi:Concanavalin A-like lectin/glucanases superfamily/Carbohydrate binding module (family 35)
MSRRRLVLAGASLITLGFLAGTPATPAGAQEPAVDPTVLVVDVSKPFKAVDQAASGSLYGLGDEGWPPDEWIAPTEPKMFTQPPPGATHLPNQEPEPVGDTLDVWPVAARNGATVTVRLPDIFPTFPYQWQGDEYWYTQVERMVRAVQASGAPNIYGYEIWNEPQWTWNPEWGDYFQMWQRTYRLIRELDPDTPIIGPSYDRDYENGLREFMTFAVETDTVPDIVSWHELGPVEGLNVAEHVAFYRELERELGIEPRPISINEYGSPRDAGVPGWLTRFVARMERAEVDTANLAFWHKPGRLADLLVPRGGGSGPATDPEPTGNYWLFDWYGDMTGSMVETTPPTGVGRYIEVGEPVPAPATRSPGQDGFGNALRLGEPEHNEYVELPDGILSELDDVTFATWVNWDGAQTWTRIFDFGSGAGTYLFLTPDAGGDADGLRLDIADGSGTVQQLVSPQVLPTGWQHVAVTLDGDTATLWLNGEQLATSDSITLNPSDLGVTTQNWIGNSQFDADPLLHATVDEFQIYDHALTQEQIRSLMTSPGGDTGGGNVAWYRFDEADGTTALDASGNGRDATVATAVTGVELIPALEGFASADRDTRTVRVIFGGGQGDIQLKIDGLRDLRGFGDRANVQVFTTEWTGTDGVSAGPIAMFEGSYRVRNGSISVPVAGLNESDAYLAVVTPARDAPDFPGPVRRYEAEDAVRRAARGSWTSASSPLASNNRYVKPKRAGRGELRFTVDAPTAGAYDLHIRYANPRASAASGAITVNGERSETIEYGPTAAPFSTHRTHVVLQEGSNDIRLRLESGAVSVDYIEVTPFRARFEAESGQWSGASRVTVDMSEGNFFAAYFSGFAYVRDLSQPNSYLELPVTVPAAGTYELEIGYSTAGDQASRRAQIPAGHILRVNDGAWQQVTYAPTQFREMIRQTTATVQLPAGTSTITLAKGHPDHPGEPQPGTVDLDYVDVQLPQ